MKQGVISLVAVAVFVIAAVYMFFGRGRPELTKDESNEKTATRSLAAPVATPAESPSATPDLSVYRTDPRWVQWNEQAARDSKFEWKTPISFFGKIEDQNGHPIEGAKVVFQWTDLSDNGSSEKTVMSDARGLFELRDVTGKRLAITQIDKEGYYAPVHGIQTSFEYAAFFDANYHQPNVNRPVVFRLRKHGERPREMVVRQTLMSIAPDGAPHFINLQTTRKSDATGGDIAIRISRAAPSDKKQYDGARRWKRSMVLDCLNRLKSLCSKRQRRVINRRILMNFRRALPTGVIVYSVTITSLHEAGHCTDAWR